MDKNRANTTKIVMILMAAALYTCAITLTNTIDNIESAHISAE